MTSLNIRVLIFIAILSLVNSYALENRWALRNSQTTALKGLRSQIFFEFDRTVSKDSRSMIGYLAISACSLLTYNYQTYDSQIFLRFLSIGRSTRPCFNGEIAFIRTQLDLTFQFYILNNVLLLRPPNNSPPIKLDLTPNPNPNPINGMWVISDSINKTKINDGKVIINGTQIAFCQGNQTFNYNQTVNARVSLKMAKNASDCNNGLLQSFNDSARFYQLNSLNSPQTLSFYNRQVKKILQLTYQDNYFPNKIITSNNFRVTVSPSLPKNTSVNNSSVSKVPVNVSSVTPNTSSVPNILRQNISSPNATNKTVALIPNISNISSSSLPQRTQNTTQSSSLSSISNTSTPNTPAESTKKSNPNPLPPSTNSPQTYSIVTQQSQIFGIWYPSTSLLPPSLSASDLSKYQIIINGARIMLNGGCNTIFSTYSFSNGSFSPKNIVSTSNLCSNNKDTPLQNIIINEKNVFYYLGEGNNKKISINSQLNTTLLLLSQNAPQ